MKCYYHEDRDAVATCQHCGKALCKACASRYTPCLCEECARLLQEQAAQQARTAEEDLRQRDRYARVDTSSGCLRN